MRGDKRRDSDAALVRRWLADAIGTDRGVKKELAALCGVQPQAVSGWLRTGRITKTNLQRLAAHFGHAPAFDAARPPAPEPAAVSPRALLLARLLDRLGPMDSAPFLEAWVELREVIDRHLAARDAATATPARRTRSPQRAS